jgi:hypothetical protein
MKTYGGVDIWIHVFLTSELSVDKWSVSYPGRFRPGKRDADNHSMKDWMDPRTGLNGGRGDKSCHFRYYNSDPSAVQPVASSHQSALSSVYVLKVSVNASWMC